MIKKKFKKPKRIQAQVEMGPGKIRKRRPKLVSDTAEERSISRKIGHKPPRGNFRNPKEVITDEIMHNLEEELTKLWNENNISNYHKEVFSQYIQLLQRDSSAAMMAKEIDDLKKNKAPIQKIWVGIIARENCLNEIKELEYNDNMDFESFITNSTNKLHSLRMLSLNVVEWIVIWREQMLYAFNQSVNGNSPPSPHIPFMWEDENYLIKMKSDTDFLKSHSISQFYNFSEKNDPFLVIPSWAHSGVGLKGLKKARRNQMKRANQDGNKYEVPLDNSHMRRIKLSEIVLEKEKQGSFSDKNMSPQTQKSGISPNKSNKKANDSAEKENIRVENNHSNTDNNNVHTRESIFDLRNKNKDSSNNLAQQHPAPSVEVPKKKEDVKRETPGTIKEEAEDEEMFDFEIFPLHLFEKDAMNYLSNFEKKLDDNMRLSNPSPANVVKKWNEGNNSQWYGIRNKTTRSEIDGMFVYSLDSHFDRVNIVHLSTIARKGFESAVELWLAHLWANTNAHEVRIELYHFDGEKAGKQAKIVDTEIRDALKNNKLRWKQILNDAHDRIIVMGGNRPETVKSVENELEHVFSIKAAAMISTSDKDSQIGISKNDKTMFFIPSLYWNSLISFPKYSPGEEENIEKPHEIILDILERMREKNKEAFPLSISNTSDSAISAIESASSNDIALESSKISKESSKYYCNTTLMDGKFISIDYLSHKVNAKDYMYLRIKWKEMVWVTVKNINSEVFFMPLGSHHNFGLVIFKKPKDVNFSSSSELFEYCIDITKHMKESEKEYPSGLYLPWFSKSIKNEKLSSLHGLPISENGNLKINDSLYSMDVTISGQKQKPATLKFDADDKSYIIDDDFIIVMTHPELEEEIKIPFMCGLISSQDWTLA
jgi:hypothetical protein